LVEAGKADRDMHKKQAPGDFNPGAELFCKVSR
jgi:hypothetical protein